MSILGKDFLLLILGEGRSPPCLSLFTLLVHVSWTMGGSHCHMKICSFKMGISRNIGKDESHGFFLFPQLRLLSYWTVSWWEYTGRKGQLSSRQCNHRWVGFALSHGYLFFQRISRFIFMAWIFFVPPWNISVSQTSPGLREACGKSGFDWEIIWYPVLLCSIPYPLKDILTEKLFLLIHPMAPAQKWLTCYPGYCLPWA